MENGPLIVQGDMSLLIEVAHPLYTEARDKISPFAELVKSPEYIHTYAISPLSLWNAASAGHSSQEIIAVLKNYSRYQLPVNLESEIRDLMDRYGKIRLVREAEDIVLEMDDPVLMTEIRSHSNTRGYLGRSLSDRRVQLLPMTRGHLKMELTRLGYPVEDLAGYSKGAALDIQFRERTLEDRPFHLRDYQENASQVFYAGGTEKGGSGIIVLPCGSGKTIVGMSAMVKCRCQTVILTTNVVASRQWIGELLGKTTLEANQIGEYNGNKKTIRPVTVATYQIITYRKRKSAGFPHFDLFQNNDWGLIIYDEVHLLPAPVFRLSADMQATRRLGLTATLIREDGKETDVFSLIGPKKYDMPWKILEQQGWIAEAGCTEIRIPMKMEEKIQYAVADNRNQISLAACNSLKNGVVEKLLQKHAQDKVLIIGQYLKQLHKLAKKLQVPLITGAMKNDERVSLFNSFRNNEIRILMVSKVGNFAVDLPDANVLIQISGTFGSRQEEAQRLGRLLRPKYNGNIASFYTLVTKDTKEQQFAVNRQLFLIEQGYSYKVESWET